MTLLFPSGHWTRRESDLQNSGKRGDRGYKTWRHSQPSTLQIATVPTCALVLGLCNGEWERAQQKGTQECAQLVLRLYVSCTCVCLVRHHLSRALRLCHCVTISLTVLSTVEATNLLKFTQSRWWNGRQ